MEKTIGYLKITLSIHDDKLGVNFESQGLNNYEVLGLLRDYEKNIWLQINKNKIQPSVNKDVKVDIKDLYGSTDTTKKLVTLEDYINLDWSIRNVRISNILAGFGEPKRLLTSITKDEFLKKRDAGIKSWDAFKEIVNNQL